MWNEIVSSMSLSPPRFRREPAEVESSGGERLRHGNQRRGWENVDPFFSERTRASSHPALNHSKKISRHCCHTAWTASWQFNKYWLSWYLGSGNTCLYEMKGPPCSTVTCVFFFSLIFEGKHSIGSQMMSEMWYTLPFSRSILVNFGCRLTVKQRHELIKKNSSVPTAV